MNVIKFRYLVILFFFLCSSDAMPIFAEDSKVSRETLKGLQGLWVLVEELQPNIQKYAKKSGLNASQLQKDIEQRLRTTNIRVVSEKDWLTLPGRPALYVNINTHETEKYWYAYNIKLELRQIVFLEANPKVRALTGTWSVNMTGMANIGNLHIIKNDAMVLVERFVAAYRSVNR